MADSTSIIDPIVQSQGSQEAKANALFDAASPAMLYGRHDSACSGLTWGYYGGHPTKSDGTIGTIANGTVTLTASTTNYIVAQKSDGVVSTAATTTNWNDTANYWRLHSIVTGTSTVTSYTDAREVGKMTGGCANALLAPVTKTTSFTVGENENRIIVNGGASVTVTLPTASAWPGRSIKIKTRAAYTVISASSNVKPLDTDTAGTAILAATAGKWAELVSDGSNWIIMAGN
jgi:hypothetical protein